MTITAALILASIWAVAILFFVLAVRAEARVRAQVLGSFRALIEPPAEGQPSPLAIYSDQVATLFAGRLMQQLKATMAGAASGASKEAESLAVGQLAGGNPWAAVLAGLLPKRFRNALLSSPQFTGQLGMFAQGPTNGQSGSGSPSVGDRLKRQQ